MMEYILFIPPTLFLMWALSPFCIRASDKAQKRIAWATYELVPKDGSNGPSQRVHEGGGFRFSTLLVVATQYLIAWLTFGGSQDVMFGGYFALIAALLAHPLTNKFVDVAEHSAECLHGDSVKLDPAAQKWIDDRGFKTYREGEAYRMTRKGQGYHGMTPDEFDDLMRSREWLARIILFLGRW